MKDGWIDREYGESVIEGEMMAEWMYKGFIAGRCLDGWELDRLLEICATN